MNPNIPFYPVQIGDNFTKYYTQANLPYVPYNAGAVGVNPYDGEKKFQGFHAAQTCSQRPFTSTPVNPASRLHQDMSAPAMSPRYQTPTTVYSRIPFQDMKRSPLSSVSPSALSYPPGSSETTPVSPVMLMNCSPEMLGHYKNPPSLVPPAAYGSPGCTTNARASRPTTPPQGSFTPAANQACLPVSNANYSFQACRPSTPPQSAEDKFKAKASQYGIEISSTLEHFLKSQEKDQKVGSRLQVDKLGHAMYSDTQPTARDLLSSFQQKAVTNGITVQDSKANEQENLHLYESDPGDIENGRCEAKNSKVKCSSWNFTRSNSSQSCTSEECESICIKQDKISEQVVDLNEEKECNGSVPDKINYNQSIDDVAKALVNDAIAFALKEMVNEGKETEERKRKLYSWQAKNINNSNSKESSKPSSDVNKSPKVSSVTTSKPLLRTLLDPGSPEFLPKDKPPSKGDKQPSMLNPSTPEFTPSAVVALPPSESLFDSVYEPSEMLQEPNLDSVLPARYLHQRSLSHGSYSKNASCQTWVQPLVDVSCSTPTVKMKDKCLETWTCDSREVGINTTEVFEWEEDDEIVIPLKDIRTKLVETQRELLLLRGRVCLDEMERQVTNLEKSKNTWTNYFDMEETSLEELIDLQITSLKRKIFCHLEKIQTLQEKLDLGELLPEVPCFEACFPCNSQSFHLANKKKLKCLPDREGYLNYLSTNTAAAALNVGILEKASEESRNKTLPNETVIITGSNKSASDSQIGKKKSKDKNKQKKSKSGKTHVKEKSDEVMVLTGKREGDGHFEKQDTSFQEDSNSKEQLFPIENTDMRGAGNQEFLSKPEEVAPYLQSEWEMSTSQGGEMKDNGTALTIANVENLVKKSNQQTQSETENLESHYVMNSSNLDSVPSLKFEPFSSSETSLDVPSSSNAMCSKTSTTSEQIAGSVLEKSALCGNETNGSLSLPESYDSAELSYCETYCETYADDRCILKSSVQNKNQDNNHTNLPGQPSSCLNPTMQNFVNLTETPTADIEKSTTDTGLNPQTVNSDALQQAMLNQGVSLDPMLFEAVKAQIAQVYPDFARDPNTLNSIAVQQTMVLQACVASGGNLGTMGALPTVESNQLNAAFQQEIAKSAEGLHGNQTNEITSCVQANQSKLSSEGASGLPVLSAEASPTQNHSSYQNPLPYRSGLPAGLTKVSLQGELGKQCELSPEIAAPPGLGDESTPCPSMLSKPSNLALDNRISTCNMSGVQRNVGASANFPDAVKKDSMPENTQSTFLPSTATKSYSSLTNDQANLTNAFCASSSAGNSSLLNNFSKANENVLHVNMKPLTNHADTPFSTMQPYFQDSTIGQHTLGCSLRSEKEVDQNKDNHIPERLETRCSPIKCTANQNRYLQSRFMDTQSDYTGKPELAVNSKIESLNLDEIEDEEDEQFELNSKASQKVFNQWQKPLIKKTTIPYQPVMPSFSSGMATKHTQMGSLKDQMKKDTNVEAGNDADRLDNISFGCDRKTPVDDQLGSGRQTPSLTKEMSDEEKENWTQVTKKGKKKDQTNLPPSSKPPLLANPVKAPTALTTLPADRSNNFEKLVQKLSEIFAGLNREEVVSVITSVRMQRGGLSGLTMKDIAVEARAFATRIMKNKNKLMTQPAYDFSMPFQKRQERQQCNEDEEICVICHDGLSSEEVKNLECGHVFHAGCIKQWVYGTEMTCPTCRRLVLFPEEFPKLGK